MLFRSRGDLLVTAWGDHRDLHKTVHSFPTRRSSDLDVLVIGARGTGGIERLLLGSVAEGAMARAPMSVLVVR